MNLIRRLFASSAPPRPRPDEMRPGAVYSEADEHGGVELARIMDYATDGLGVTHVRFELIYRYRNKTLSAGERTLALDAFQSRFPRRLPDEDAPEPPPPAAA